MNRRVFLSMIFAALLPKHVSAESPESASSAWDVDRWQQGAVGVVTGSGSNRARWMTNSNPSATVTFFGGIQGHPSTLTTFSSKVTRFDMTGSTRLHKADAKCRRAGRVRERFGLKPRERSQLERMHCQKIDGEWRTTRIAQAD